MNASPLTGVHILELGQIIAGTYSGQVLSDLGAEVIKIEAPEGDLGRNPSVAPYRGASGLFLTFNRNKKSVVINLKTQAGRAIFYDLVKVCDVVVDNFRPGVLERLEIDYAKLSALNPRLIQCSVTGFGSNGEYRNYPALDLVVQVHGQDALARHVQQNRGDVAGDVDDLLLHHVDLIAHRSGGIERKRHIDPRHIRSRNQQQDSNHGRPPA